VFSDWSYKKETFKDASGEGYRYCYSCNAHLNGRTIRAEGRYGTRDKFLGYANGNWRPVEDINENYIQNAAYHICMAAAIKAFLGVRGLSAARLKEIMGTVGKKAEATKAVKHNTGADGGASEDDRLRQHELYKLLSDMYGGVEADMKAALVELTSFKGKDGEIKSCDSIKAMKGKWLEGTLAKAKALHAKWIEAQERGEQ
jgi:hypothetical protein